MNSCLPLITHRRVISWPTRSLAIESGCAPPLSTRHIRPGGSPVVSFTSYLLRASDTDDNSQLIEATLPLNSALTATLEVQYNRLR